MLWPPNHKFVDVAIAGVVDADGNPVPVTITITGIAQDEPRGPCPDASGVGSDLAHLRAERRGNGDGRVYHVTFQAVDARAQRCTGTVFVTVPLVFDGNKSMVIDEGPRFDSTVCLQTPDCGICVDALLGDCPDGVPALRRSLRQVRLLLAQSQQVHGKASRRLRRHAGRLLEGATHLATTPACVTALEELRRSLEGNP